MNSEVLSPRPGTTPLAAIVVVIGGTAHRAARRDEDGDVTWACSGLNLAAALASAHGLVMAPVEECLWVESIEPGSVHICPHCRPLETVDLGSWKPDEPLPFDMDGLTDLPAADLVPAPAGFVERMLDMVFGRDEEAA